MIYQNKGTALGQLGDEQAAAELYGRAVAIYERLVLHEGRQELDGDLGRAIVYQADALRTIGERQRAVALARQGIAHLGAATARTDRADLQQLLAWARSHLADLL